MQGAFRYRIGHVFVYHAETRIVSGLAAVAFSASPFVTMVCERVMHGTPPSVRVGAGGMLGPGGVALSIAGNVVVMRRSATPAAVDTRSADARAAP
ncbi:MAG: hypothetical protein U1F52_08565 [Burkholderiales bacterium]